jgi:hypothetical protein
MTNRFYAINRGNDGFRLSDFTAGAASSAATDFELRVADVDGQGKVMTRKDVYLALIALQRLFMSDQLIATLNQAP